MRIFRRKPPSPCPSPPEEPHGGNDLRIINSWPSISQRDVECASPTSLSSTRSNQTISAFFIDPPPARFVAYPDGTHAHSIKYAGPSRFATSLHNLTHLLPTKSLFGEKKNADLLKKERIAVNSQLHRPPDSDVCVAEKWGACHQVIGKGAFGVVRMVYKGDDPSQASHYAVKEIRRKGSESTDHYIKRLTTEFRTSSLLHHPNVVETLDLLPLNHTSPVYCQVMQYCDGGDLFGLVYDNAPDGLELDEANCLFKQLVHGIAYLHSMGIAHRDIKPENLLLTANGTLKISDFGSAARFEPNQPVLAQGLYGSEHYIAPEMFTSRTYDPRKTDVWSAGIVYMVMRTGAHPWHVAKADDDDDYTRYLEFRSLVEHERDKTREERRMGLQTTEQERIDAILTARETVRIHAKRRGLDVFEGLGFDAKRILYRILDPTPHKRITIPQIIENPWFTTIACCRPPL